MAIWFKTGGWRPDIVEVEVTRETELCVFTGNPRNERRHAMRSSYENYWRTEAEATAFLINKAEEEVRYARERLEAAERTLTRLRHSPAVQRIGGQNASG